MWAFHLIKFQSRLLALCFPCFADITKAFSLTGSQSWEYSLTMHRNPDHKAACPADSTTVIGKGTFKNVT